jgi:uncharacterized protein YcfJ
MLFSKVRVTGFETGEKEVVMNKFVQKALFVLPFLVSPAWAAHGASYDYAKVISVRPVVETVRVPVDSQVCADRPVRRRVAEYRSPGPVVFGAILGGVIGNQLSRHSGHGRHHHHDRGLATAAGAAIGGVVAREVQYRKYPPRYYTEIAEVCETQTAWHREERVVAWDVKWKYRGKVHRTRMDEHPGKRIRVRVNIAPVYR